MDKITFDNEETALLVHKLQGYFESELNQEIGQFDAEFLIDFLSENFGGYYYNRGLKDAQGLIRMKLEDIEVEIESLEMPTD